MCCPPVIKPTLCDSIMWGLRLICWSECQVLVLVLSGAIPIKVQFSVWIMSTVQFITFFTIQSLKENSSILEPGLYVYIFGTFTGCNLVGDSPKDYVSAIAALWRLLGGRLFTGSIPKVRMNHSHTQVSKYCKSPLSNQTAAHHLMSVK